MQYNLSNLITMRTRKKDKISILSYNRKNLADLVMTRKGCSEHIFVYSHSYVDIMIKMPFGKDQPVVIKHPL